MPAPILEAPVWTGLQTFALPGTRQDCVQVPTTSNAVNPATKPVNEII